MPALKTHTGKAYSVSGGMAMSSLVNMVVTILWSLVITYLMNRETITWQQAGYWIMGGIFCSSFLGAKTAFAFIKRQRLLISLMSGILYWGILLCITALFFGGNCDAVLETAGIIGAGSVTSGLLMMPVPPKKHRKKGSAYR